MDNNGMLGELEVRVLGPRAEYWSLRDCAECEW